MQAPAEVIGKAGSAADSYLKNFGEESVRGHPMFVCSRLVQHLERAVRNCSGKGPWEAVSVGAYNGVAQGAPLVVELSTLQGASGASAVAEAAGTASGVVLLSESFDGLEDVPPGVTAVLSRSNVDLLSHLALRARQSGALLACCSDTDVWKAVVDGANAQADGNPLCVKLDNGTGSLQLDSASDDNAPVASVTKNSPPVDGQEAPSRSMGVVGNSSSWAVAPPEYSAGVVGGKSINLERLRSIAAEVGASTGVNVKVPSSVALPFGAFERVIEAEENASAQKALQAALVALESAGGDRTATRSALANARAAVEQLSPPTGLIEEVREASSAASAHAIVAACEVAPEPSWWPEVRRVWASKWNERAHASRVAMGIREVDLHMAVLIMELVPSQYSFVLHSRNPLAPSSPKGEMLGEVVVGLGETLVGNHPGSPLRFTATSSSGAPAASGILFHALPSKLEAMCAVDCDKQPLICRSDSNGEDLEEFAGAGLYDSFTTSGGVASAAVDYSNEPLLWDDAFRTSMCDKLARVAISLEEHMDGPQDIEGSVVGETVYLLQARRQQL